MWKQLTQKARKAIFLAQEEAGRLGYNHAGTEHLLLALIREEDCVAARILERAGVDLGTVRLEVMGRVSRGSDMLGEDMQLTAEAKAAVDLAFDESKRMKEDWVGTEHLLLGLVRSTSGLASKVLRGLGVDVSQIRTELRSLHSGALPFECTKTDGGNSVSLPAT